MTYYRTELMDQILTSPEARKIVGQVSAIYGESDTALWLFQVIGAELEEMLQWGTEYKKQIVPQTSTWSLPYWERTYNIAPPADATEEQRRGTIMSTILTRAPMNPAKLERIISEIMSDPTASVKLLENTAKNTFEIWFEPGGKLFDYKRISAKVDALKPAHLIYFMNARLVNRMECGIDLDPRLTVISEINALSLPVRFMMNGSYWQDGAQRMDGFLYEELYNKDFLQSLLSICSTLNIQSNSECGAYLLSDVETGKVSPESRIAFQEGFNARGASEAIARFTAAAEHSMRSESTVVVNQDLWELNGGFFLDGTKRLNANQKEINL